MSSDSSPTAHSLNTTLLMSGSAVFMGSLGLATSLFSQSTLTYLGLQPESSSLLLISVIGALYLGFAGLNWMAREHLIGGIYGRPVAMGNFLHFFVAAVGLSEQLLIGPMQIVLAGVTAAYILFAIGFSYVLFAGGQSCG